MKTNKSYTKRIKITKTGKLLSRQAGQDHFNAKSRRSKQLAQHRPRIMVLSNKNISRYLPNLVKR